MFFEEVWHSSDQITASCVLLYLSASVRDSDLTPSRSFSEIMSSQLRQFVRHFIGQGRASSILRRMRFGHIQTFFTVRFWERRTLRKRLWFSAREGVVWRASRQSSSFDRARRNDSFKRGRSGRLAFLIRGRRGIHSDADASPWVLNDPDLSGRLKSQDSLVAKSMFNNRRAVKSARK